MPMVTRSKSSASGRQRTSAPRPLLVHPGEVLAEHFLEPLGITQRRLAQATRLPARHIVEILHGTRGVTADTALRLARYFGTSEWFWLNLQARYDLERERDRLGERLTRDVEVWSAVGGA